MEIETMEKEIADWRRKIDDIDDNLLRLFNERAECAVAIGRIKRREKLEVYDPDREHQIMAHMTETNNGPMDEKAVQSLFRRVIDESRRIERLSLEEDTNSGTAHDKERDE